LRDAVVEALEAGGDAGLGQFLLVGVALVGGVSLIGSDDIRICHVLRARSRGRRKREQRDAGTREEPVSDSHGVGFPIFRVSWVRK
jgi:hypothetical protein